MAARPANPQRQSTAANSRATRPTNHQRQSTIRTMRTARTDRPEGEIGYSMAGPPQQTQTNIDPHNTYYEEGYQRLNPQMSKGNPQPNFSLASTFPHKVRWGKREPKEGEPKAVEEPDKTGTEPAPMVNEANEQGTRQDHQPEEGRNNVENAELKELDDNASDTHIQRRAIDAYNADGERLGNVAEEAVVDPDEEDLPFNHWAIVRQKFQLPLAEWLGTTILIFIGVSANLSVTTSGNVTGSLSTLQAPCWGFAVMLAIYVAGGSSGAFLNPALTIMLSIFRGFPARRVPVYISAQIIGAFTGALLAFAVYRDNIFHLDGALLPETTGIAFYTQPKDWVSNTSGFLTEFLGSAVIGCSILALGDSGNSPPGAGMHAFIIGLLTTTVTMSLGYSTDGTFNPIRDFGPRLATLAVGYPTSIFTAKQNWWIWGPWCATITGTLVGAFVYDLCIFKGGESPVNYSSHRWKTESLKESRDFSRAMGLCRAADDIERKLEDGDLYDSS